MLDENEQVIDGDKGIYIRAGRHANTYKNKSYLVFNKDTEQEYYKMSCNKNNDKYTIIDKEDYIFLINIQPFRPVVNLHQNGYAFLKLPSGEKLFLHSIIIKNMYRNNDENDDEKIIDDEKYCIEHINNNILDNRRKNLRWAIKKIKNKKKNKRNRKKNAIKLPPQITQDMIPKYVYYCKECYNKEKKLYREFFRIEKHPNMTKKCISGSKSRKISINDKLQQIIYILQKLDNDTYDENKVLLPKYYSIRNFRDAQHITYDRKLNGERLTLKMKMKFNKTLEQELERFNEKLFKKYPELENQQV